MNQASTFAAFAKDASLTTHFALMTDLTRVLPAPAEHAASQVPGILFNFDRDIKDLSETSVFGTLLQGSSPTPFAVVALAYERHAFYLVANPLDEVLRPMLEQQRKAKRLPNMLVLPNEKFVRAAPEVVAWNVALNDTEGRKPNDPKKWLSSAQDFSPLLPLLLGGVHAPIRRSKWHHVYFVVPDEQSHPLYSLVE